jgi:hypothetical protein
VPHSPDLRFAGSDRSWIAFSKNRLNKIAGCWPGYRALSAENQALKPPAKALTHPASG